jgi:hypothetical protein
VGNALIESEIRIGWARKKLDELKNFIETANQSTADFAVRERQVDGMKMLFHFQDQTHYEAVRLVSEFLLHGRAALDYIIFNLARNNTGREQDGTQFPICERPEDFEEVVRRKRSPLEFLTKEQVALVGRFQPYNRFPLLAFLNRISNRDKHREFHISASEGFRRLVPITEAHASGRRRIPSDQVGMEFEISYDVLLDDGLPAAETLQKLHALLSQILNEFNSLLDP